MAVCHSLCEADLSVCRTLLPLTPPRVEVLLADPYYRDLIPLLPYNKGYVGFEVLTAVSTKMAVFWVVAPCSLVETSTRLHSTTTQKTSHLNKGYVNTIFTDKLLTLQC
jgi:hypothetical protein